MNVLMSITIDDYEQILLTRMPIWNTVTTDREQWE